MPPGILSVSHNGAAEYILYGKDRKVVCLLLLQLDGSVSFKRMSIKPAQPPSASINAKPQSPSVPTKETILQLAALDLTLDTQFQLLSVKDRVGIYGAYSST
jgi:hypothetical protein